MKKFHQEEVNQRIQRIERLIKIKFNKNRKTINKFDYDIIQNIIFQTIEYIQKNKVGWFFRYRKLAYLRDLSIMLAYARKVDYH